MSDLISRQAAIDAIVGLTNCESLRELYEYVVEHDLNDRWSGGLVDATDAVVGLPSADAVEVVRCKDCKRWYDSIEGLCLREGMVMSLDDYCSYGSK